MEKSLCGERARLHSRAALEFVVENVDIGGSDGESIRQYLEASIAQW